MTVQWRQKREKSLFLTYLFKSTGANGIANKEKQELMDSWRTAVKSESDQPPPRKYKIRYPKWNISLSCICHIEIKFITVAVTDMLVKDFSENLEEWRTWQEMSASALFQMDSHSLKLPNTKWSEKNNFNGKSFLNWEQDLCMDWLRLQYRSKSQALVSVSELMNLVCQNCTKHQ